MKSRPRSDVSPDFPIVWQESLAYEKARIDRVFNHRRPSRYPLAVVEATNEGHIVQAIQLANELGCRVSVRSGGHSWAAWSVREGSILIDLGNYQDFSLNDRTGVMSVSPSITSQLVNSFLGARGRMFPGGHCPGVGLGGFLLQGGMGWNCKNWGFACEQIVAIDVVTADGKQLYCDKKNNSDLFWAARGAGPGFPAIVTRFHLQTLPSFSHMRSSAYFYGKADYRKVVEWAIQMAPKFDESTEIVATASYLGGSSDICIMVLFLTFKDSEGEARAALQPAEDSAPPAYTNKWFCKETSLAQEYDNQHRANPAGHRWSVDNCYIRNDVDVVSVMEPAFTTLPSKKSFCLWYPMAPGSNRSAEDGTMEDMALSMQTDHYFATYCIWDDESEDQHCQSWVRNIFEAVEKHSDGAYLGDADFQVRRTRFWGKEQGRRLMEIRKRWDPSGVVAGFLDSGDKSGIEGLKNEHEWGPDIGTQVP